MKENISRSTIFRSKMKIEASNKKEEVSGKTKINRSEYFYSHRRTSLPEENIGKEPGE